MWQWREKQSTVEHEEKNTTLKQLSTIKDHVEDNFKTLCELSPN